MLLVSIAVTKRSRVQSYTNHLRFKFQVEGLTTLGIEQISSLSIEHTISALRTFIYP